MALVAGSAELGTGLAGALRAQIELNFEIINTFTQKTAWEIADTLAVAIVDYINANSDAETDPLALRIANNLSDLANVVIARSNLELGTAALANTGDFDAFGAAASVASDLATHQAITTGAHGTGTGALLTSDTDITLAANSDLRVATQKAVKAYIDASGGYTDEQAQDAIGGMLADTATVNLTYTDTTPELKADVIPTGIKLDDLGTTDDNTDLNASTGAHGLMPKGTGSTNTFYRSDMTQAVPPGSLTLGQALALSNGQALP